jgi:hypothetical protein
LILVTAILKAAIMRIVVVKSPLRMVVEVKLDVIGLRFDVE